MTGCMRMRKLGQGQSVVFCVPAEIADVIASGRGTGQDEAIEVSEVLAWAIAETFAEHRRSMPLWARQGRRFRRQEQMWQAARADGVTSMTRASAEEYLEDEARTLEQLYRPDHASGGDDVGKAPPSIVDAIEQRCREFGVTSMADAVLEEEQERELSPEIEEERQVERPAAAQAQEHVLHPDLSTLVATGEWSRTSSAWMPAFRSLSQTSAARYVDVGQFPEDLLATLDFARTICTGESSSMLDSFVRPVQWVITARDDPSGMIAILISPFEAQRLLSDVRRHRKVTLHVYAARSSLQFGSLDSLALFTEGRPFEASSSPSRVRTVLNLFAGQLYFNDWDHYTAACELLGLAWQLQEDGVMIGPDGFLATGGTGFTRSPVGFMHVLMTKLRRDCESIRTTHVGCMLDGTLLDPAEFTVEVMR